MIEFFVNAFRELIQIILVGGIALGAYLATVFIPDVVNLTDNTIEFNTFGKAAVGGIATFFAEVIVFGPFLMLLDIREGIRATEAKVAALHTDLKDTLKDLPKASSLSSIDSQLYEVKNELVKQTQQGRPLTGQNNNTSSAV